MIKLCTPAMETTQDSLLDRIRAVEEKVEKADFSTQGEQRVVYVQEEKQAGPVERPKLEKAIPDDVQMCIRDRWNRRQAGL